MASFFLVSQSVCFLILYFVFEYDVLGEENRSKVQRNPQICTQLDKKMQFFR